MIKLLRCDSSNVNFIELVAELDQYLTITDGDEHDFYDQYNHIDDIKYAIVAFKDNIAAGCGAIKYYKDDVMEIKRMYVNPLFRKKGIAAKILKELEVWALELNYKKCILETGSRQVEAIAFYKKLNYKQTPNFGVYKDVENSLCFEKELSI